MKEVKNLRFLGFKTNLAVLLLWKLRISISNSDRDCLRRTFNVIQNKSSRDCVDDILVQSLNSCLRIPWAGEESWRFCKALWSIWRVFNFDF